MTSYDFGRTSLNDVGMTCYDVTSLYDVIRRHDTTLLQRHNMTVLLRHFIL